jgi:hypothetical protein
MHHAPKQTTAHHARMMLFNTDEVLKAHPMN